MGDYTSPRERPAPTTQYLTGGRDCQLIILTMDENKVDVVEETAGEVAVEETADEVVTEEVADESAA